MCLKTRKTQNGPAQCTERIRNCGIFYQVYSKVILLFFNGVVKTWQTFQIKWDLLVILNVFKLNLVICLHSNNAHLKKKIGARHGSFKGTMCTRHFLRRQKWFLKCALSYFFIFQYCLQLICLWICRVQGTDHQYLAVSQGSKSLFFWEMVLFPSSHRGKMRAGGCTGNRTQQSLNTLLAGQTQNFVSLTISKLMAQKPLRGILRKQNQVWNKLWEG